VHEYSGITVNNGEKDRFWIEFVYRKYKHPVFTIPPGRERDSRRGAAFGGDDYLVLPKNVDSEGIRNIGNIVPLWMYGSYLCYLIVNRATVCSELAYE
jgi:hypothetical protein